MTKKLCIAFAVAALTCALNSLFTLPLWAEGSQSRSIITQPAIPVIIDPIDESNRTVLSGNTRGEMRPEFDRGPVDDSFPMNGMQLQLRRSPERERAAEALADELQRKGSRQFHHWLTVSQYAEQFGVAPEDIAKITDWLRAHGFTVHAPIPSRMNIDFSGTAAQVRGAFGTEIHALEVDGEHHIANVRNPSIPAALASAIEGIVSLNDFRPRPMLAPRPLYNFTLPDGNAYQAVVPADLAAIYHFNPLFSAGTTGQGQTIALIEDSDVYNPNDWVTFRRRFGLDIYKGASLNTVHPGGCTNPGINVNGDDLEAILDTEWASAAAPGANLLLATCANTNTVFGGLIAIQNLLNQGRVPPIISLSYEDCEAQNGAASNAAYRTAYLQAVLEGVSVVVGAGDSGSATCDSGPTPASGVAVNALASTPYNISIGGSDFGDTYAGTNTDYWSPTNGPNYRSALSYVPEIPWNSSCASSLISSFEGYATPYGANGFCASAFGEEFLFPAAGGGGPSNCATGASAGGVNGATPSNGTCQGWKKPNWQSVLGNPQDGARDLPDVSMFASSGVWGHLYVYCNSDPATGTPCGGAPSYWSLGGGTSFATPIMAGVQALVNQVWGSRQGNPAPIYYSLARQEYGTQGSNSCESWAAGGPASNCTFYDVTVGDNDVDCIGPYNCYNPAANAEVRVGVLSVSDNSYKPAFTAGVGWDFATGLGTVNAANLVLNPIWAEGW
jgi:subtilase family serine protease